MNPTSSGRPKLVPRVFSIYQCIYLIRGTQARRQTARRGRAPQKRPRQRALSLLVMLLLLPFVTSSLLLPAGRSVRLSQSSTVASSSASRTRNSFPNRLAHQVDANAGSGTQAGLASPKIAARAGRVEALLDSGASLEAASAATLILKSDRTTEETAELKSFIRDLCVSVQTTDTRVSNREVHHPPHAHPPPAQPAHPPRPPSDPASVSHPSAGERALEDEDAAGRRWPMGLGDRRPEAVRSQVPVVDRGHRHLPNAVGFLRGQEVLAHRQRARPVQEQVA